MDLSRCAKAQPTVSDIGGGSFPQCGDSVLSKNGGIFLPRDAYSVGILSSILKGYNASQCEWLCRLKVIFNLPEVSVLESFIMLQCCSMLYSAIV